MTTLSDKEVLEVSHKYNITPGSLKCNAFALFDRGFSRRDVVYLLRRFRNGQPRTNFSSAIRRYHAQWQLRQEE